MGEELLHSLRLRIDPEAYVLICYHPDCLFALSSHNKQVSSHLSRKHQVSVNIRSLVLNFLRTQRPALRDPAGAPSRPDGSLPDPNLQILDGFACKICDFRTISKQSRSRHLTEHRQQVVRQGGVESAAMFSPVYLQAWVRNPPEGRYWVVYKDGHKTRPVGGQQTIDHLEDVLSRERQRKQSSAHAGATAALDAPAFPELRPWLERTGWGVTYQVVNRVLLRSLALLPCKVHDVRPLVVRRVGTGEGNMRLHHDIVISAADEQKIAILAVAAMGVMKRCEYTARTTSRNLLCWLRSVRFNEPYSKPFALVGRASSRTKYYALLRRLIAMVFRAFRLPAQVRQQAAGIRFKRSQLDLITALWNHEVWEEKDVADPAFWGHGQPQEHPAVSPGAADRGHKEGEFEDEAWDSEGMCEYEEGESDCSGSDTSEGGGASGQDKTLPAPEPSARRELTSRAKKFLELLFQLLITFCTEEITDGRPASTLLVYFSGVLGFLPDCTSFLPARSYTSHLAGLLYIQRLLFLEHALPARPYPHLGLPQRPRTDQLPRLQAVRRAYIVAGAPSPFEEIFCLMAYGRAMAATDTPPFLLRWSDDGQSVSYDDQLTITMGQFRTLPDVVLREAEGLCDTLMYGWQPKVDLGSIKDSLTNRGHGYSFVTHPPNGLAEAYAELSFRACTSEQRSLSKNGTWHRNEVYTYLKKEKTYREALGLLMLISGGGQPRAPELLHLRCQNTMTAECGIFVYDGSMMYVTRSHKAKRSTNREFYVARFLPIQVGRLLFKYLVYIRPFVNMLAREQTPSIQATSTYLFRAQPADHSEPWTTEHLSNVIRRYTRHAQAWGPGITLQTLRQLSVGISEKHVREVYQPFNRFDDRTDAADRNVAFAWQSCHRPLQRARSYGLDGAFPTQLQPQLLERYMWVSSRWHEFLHLPSKASTEKATLDYARNGGKESRSRVEEDDHGRFTSAPPAAVPVIPGVSSSPVTSSNGKKLKLGPLLSDPGTKGESRKRLLASDRETSKTKRKCVAPSMPVCLEQPTQLEQGRDTSDDEPLFGCLRVITTAEEAEERNKVGSYMGAKMPTASLANPWAAKFTLTESRYEGGGDDAQDRLGPSPQGSSRLERIHDNTEKWRFVGCELCYATTGRREPSHRLEGCERWSTSQAARRVLGWLEGLDVPRFYGERGACAMCGHGCLPCDEMRMRFKLEKARTKPHALADLIAVYDAKKGPDGFCANRPVVRRMIAALSCYDDQILGKVMTWLSRLRYFVDLSDEKAAKDWFEQRVGLTNGYWVPWQLYALDQLLLGFHWRLDQRKPSKTTTTPVRKLQWDNQGEIEDWREALDWLRDRCSFCAGRGLGDESLHHALRTCHRGGAAKVRGVMGDLLYGGDYEPADGCDYCHLPRNLCSRWEALKGGRWTEREDGACDYARHLLYDGIVGFWNCGVRLYREPLEDEIDLYFMDQDEDPPEYFEDEHALYVLTQPLTVAGVRGSNMMRRLALWVRGAEAFKDSCLC